MDTIFINFKNSETSEPHRLLLNLSIYYTLKNIKKSYRNNTFKTSAPT